jgi:hypothetical protein
MVREFDAIFPDSELFKPAYSASAFAFPKMPVISSDTPKEISLFQWALDSRVQTAYIVEILCPKINEIYISPKKLSALQQTEIIHEIGKKSLRELAREYDISYETVRRITKRN